VVPTPLAGMVVPTTLAGMVVSTPIDHHNYSQLSGAAPVVERSLADERSPVVERSRDQPGTTEPRPSGNNKRSFGVIYTNLATDQTPEESYVYRKKDE